ncbi:hypothetical protein [Kushneria aurantia]|uniref:Uncharacterized protein n=1 Tax=Kushneria aurantia TaxID=504092 RepID=A0ABV6G4N2_9GAMM|nr:hypothetical protein [Kushneria aurantia]
MAQPRTKSDFIGDRFLDLIERGEQIPEFELRRLELEVRKLPNEYEKSLDMAYLYAIWGRYPEARDWLKAAGGFGLSTALRYAGAAQASLNFHETRKALRWALDQGLVTTEEDRHFAFVLAAFSCALEICTEIKDMLTNTDRISHMDGTIGAMLRISDMGLKDEDVQEYVMRALCAADPWLRDKRRAMVIGHAAYPEMLDKVIIQVSVPADPDEFGDILWAMSDIDRTGIPQEVSQAVIISPVPAE